MVSAAGHTAVIALAILATAQARVDEPREVQVVRWINPPAPSAPATAAEVRSVDRPVRTALPDFRILERISVVTPSIDPTPILPSFNSVPITGDPVISGLTWGSGEVGTATEALTADEVEHQVSLRQGSPAPRYPAALRAAGIEGEVVAVFVVNERGRAELETLRFTRSDHSLFEAAVKDALSALRFVSAEVGGRKVRQLVQMPFVFRLFR
jgi:protein TonB